ncbi:MULTISPECIES: HAD family hydrolase [unclassified Microbacterium]|uniref:HAD family hydrolase n=3 Tax=Microbacterium TaxID=33882 RepID=UPI0015E30C24|nr:MULTISPECIES: HAD family hydrolase [unclassified Microbacterium]
MTEPLVIFDLDDTLIDYAQAADRALASFAHQRGLGESGVQFLRDVNAGTLTVHEAWQLIGEHFLLPESADELARSVAATLPDHAVAFEGAVEGLNSLREAGWRTALLSNGSPSVQLTKVRATGMEELFDAVLICDPGGTRKPDPTVFEDIAVRAGGGLRNSWMVGDSLTSDIGGGQAAGLTTLWISHGRILPDHGPQPDHVVSNISAAFQILLKEGPTS